MEDNVKLHHFLIGKGYAHSHHVSLNDSGEVVHDYKKNIFNKRKDGFSKDYVKFLESIGLTVNNIFSNSTCADSLEDAKMSLMVTQNLERLGSSAKFNQLFDTGEQGNSSIELTDEQVIRLEAVKKYMETKLEKISKGAGL